MVIEGFHGVELDVGGCLGIECEGFSQFASVVAGSGSPFVVFAPIVSIGSPDQEAPVGCEVQGQFINSVAFVVEAFALAFTKPNVSVILSFGLVFCIRSRCLGNGHGRFGSVAPVEYEFIDAFHFCSAIGCKPLSGIITVLSFIVDHGNLAIGNIALRIFGQKEIATVRTVF